MKISDVVAGRTGRRGNGGGANSLPLFQKWGAVGQRSENFCSKMRNLWQKISIMGIFMGKIEILAFLVFLIGKLQLSVLPTFLVHDFAGGKQNIVTVFVLQQTDWRVRDVALFDDFMYWTDGYPHPGTLHRCSKFSCVNQTTLTAPGTRIKHVFLYHAVMQPPCE